MMFKWGVGVILGVALAMSLALLGGCATVSGSAVIVQQPLIGLPAVKTAGVLKVGVNPTRPPLAGKSSGDIVGINVDIAAALADTLGLKLELINIQDADYSAMIAAGEIDVTFDIEQSAKDVTGATVIGPYIYNGPALFMLTNGAEVSPIAPSALTGVSIVAQKDSLAAWTIDQVVRDANVQSVESLDAAFKQLQAGQVRYAAADSVVGSFRALEYEGVAGVQLLGDPIKVYMGVALDNAQLASALTDSLRQIRDNGVLNVIICKWLGPQGAKLVQSQDAVVSQSGESLLAGQTTTANN